MTLHKFTHSGNILLAGFAGMLIMMSVLVYLSVKQDIPMVSKNYYQQELVYQTKLDAMKNAGMFNSGFTVEQNKDHLILRIPSSLSKSISRGSVYFYCPSIEKMDRKEELYASDDGTYLLQSDVMADVKYIIKISFRSGNRDYYKELMLH